MEDKEKQFRERTKILMELVTELNEDFKQNLKKRDIKESMVNAIGMAKGAAILQDAIQFLSGMPPEKCIDIMTKIHAKNLGKSPEELKKTFKEPSDSKVMVMEINIDGEQCDYGDCNPRKPKEKMN